MVKIIHGYYGPKLLGPGTLLNLDSKEEEWLVEIGVAVKVTCDTANQKSDNAIQEENTSDSEQNSIETNQQEGESGEEIEMDIKSKEELEKMRSKKQIIEYAESVGFHDLSEDMSKAELVDAVLNYLEENFEVVE